MADISERRIRPIEEAAESKNWKQALQLVEKWHKKGERSGRFLAIRASVLARQQDSTLTRRGRDELVELCNRSPAITDIDTIYQLQTALVDLNIAGDGVSMLWQRAVAAKPEDNNLILAWLTEAIDQCDWQTAQKATMALRKRWPKVRRYEFWTIFTYYMIYHDHTVPEKERTLSGTLAYRMLSKAAEGDTKDAAHLPAKVIKSPEELFLLARIYLDTGHVHEVKQLLLDSSTLGPESAPSKLDPDLHSSLQLKLLQESRDWPVILARLWTGLAHQSSGNPQLSRMLEILLSAVEQANDFNLLRAVRECLENHLDVHPTLRWLQLGMLRLRQTELRIGQCSFDGFSQACKDYFSSRREGLSCFDELRSCFEELDPTLQRRLVHLTCDINVKNADWSDVSTISTLNTLKMEYCFLVSSNPSREMVRGFTAKVIGMYRKAVSTSTEFQQAAAQLALLACMSAARPGDSQQRPVEQSISLLKNGFLLRYCLVKCEDDYPTLVVLVRFLILLGGVSLAAKLFEGLNIKNLQWENSGYLLLTRLSTLHPHGSTVDDETFDPLQMLDLAISANTDSVRSMRRHIMSGLNSETYVNVMETITMREQLKKSFSKQLYHVEIARASRLRDLPRTESVMFTEGPFSDRRDSTFIPSFEHPSIRPFAQVLEAGPKPKGGWLRSMVICSQIADIVYDDFHEPRSVSQDRVHGLVKPMEELANLLESSHEELTKTELAYCQVQLYLGRALGFGLEQAFGTASTGSTADTATSNSRGIFDESIQKLQAWLKDTLEQHSLALNLHPGVASLATTTLAPSWQYLHTSILTLDSLQVIALFLHSQANAASSKARTSFQSKSYTSRPNPYLLPAKQRQDIRQLVIQTETSIHNSAKGLKENLDAAGVLGSLVDVLFDRGQADTAAGEGSSGGSQGNLGNEMETLPGAETVAETFCAELIESWVDALDGILRIKVNA